MFARRYFAGRYFAPRFFPPVSEEEPRAAIGGAFRRSLPTWARVFARSPATLRRTLVRSLPSWSRVWRFDPMALATESGPALTAAESDDRDYGFDCSKAPELADATGITISSGEILASAATLAALTIGSVSVLAEDFDDIASGKGLKVRVSGGEAGTVYKLACLVTLSDGREFVVPGRLSKVADYDT